MTSQNAWIGELSFLNLDFLTVSEQDKSEQIKVHLLQLYRPKTPLMPQNVFIFLDSTNYNVLSEGAMTSMSWTQPSLNSVELHGTRKLSVYNPMTVLLT